MGDVEFLAPGPAADGDDDDVLAVGPRRNVPRRLVVLAVALLAGAVVSAAIATRSHRSPHHQAQPSFQPAPPPAIRSPVGVDRGSLAPDALAIAVAGGRLYSLTPTALTSVNLNTTRVASSAPFTPVLSYTDRYFRLAYDSSADSVWVVPIGGRSAGEVIEFDGADLHRMRTVRLPTTLASAAVLEGVLYLGTADLGLLRVPPGGRTVSTALREQDGIGPMAADPDRRRLIYLTDGPPTQVRSWAPDGRSDPAHGRLDFSKADVVVVSGSIWAAGFGNPGAAVVRLDPDTLAPVQSDDRLTARLGEGAILAAGGDRDFFVRGGADADQLWCVDGRTGGIEELWAGPSGAVASGAGQVWVSNATGTGSLVLRACVG